MNKFQLKNSKLRQDIINEILFLNENGLNIVLLFIKELKSYKIKIK